MAFFCFFFVSRSIYLWRAYSCLSISMPGKARHPGCRRLAVMKICWLKAKEEFTAKPYKLLITTGFPYWKGFQMGQDGKIVFKTSSQGKSNFRQPVYHFTYNQGNANVRGNSRITGCLQIQ